MIGLDGRKTQKPVAKGQSPLGLQALLALLGYAASLDILAALAEHTLRFGELEKLLAVSPRTLTERLRELERFGLVEYALTTAGQELSGHLQVLQTRFTSDQNP
jgi:DNA-binding HxlR family transcriptional regulator